MGNYPPVWLVSLQAIITIIFFIAILYIIGGIADNLKKIRQIHEEFQKQQKSS